MARAERRRPVRRERGFSWWWLALPVLGVAGYAAFAATLSLLGDDGAGVREPSHVVMPVPGSAPVSGPAVVPDVVPAPEVAPAADAAAASAATAAPEPSATPPAQRAAADEGAARKVKPKRAPQEHLTEQDRRALDAIVEQAGKNAR